MTVKEQASVRRNDGKRKPRPKNAIVSQRIEVTPDLIKLRIVPDGWDLPEFIPGQYLTLSLQWADGRYHLADLEDISGKKPERYIRRAYSIASSSKTKEYVEFYIGLVRSGTLSPRLFELKAGDRVLMGKEPVGLLTLDTVPSEFNVVLIATGTGVAPYMSMIRTEVSGGLNRRFAVIHGARHSSDLGYHSELVMLDSTSESFHYFPIIGRPEAEPAPWPGRVGSVQSLWTAGLLDEVWGFHPTPRDTHVFLCGNPKMVTDTMPILEAEGFTEQTERTEGQIHTEKYF